MQDTIEIKFKGDSKNLTEAIKALDKATKSLINSQAKLVDKERKGISTKEKHKKQVEALIISVKALGGQWSKNSTLLGLHKKALGGDKIAMQQLRNETSKYIVKLKQTRKGMLDSAHSSRILGGSFAVLRSKMLIASFAIMLVERTVISLVQAFAKQEAVNKKLQAGLANIEGTTEGVTQRLIDYSSALQQTTAFGDEMITNGMAQLTTFGLNEEAIKSLTPQVLNVARAIQTTSGAMPDLNSLFIAFGKSTSTAVSALTRYGVVLTDAEKAQLTAMGANERAGAIANILDKQYGGLAEAYAKTTMGMLESASAARGDAAEAFGEVLAPAVLVVSRAMKTLFEAMSPEKIKAYATGIGIGIIATVGLAVATKKLNLQLNLSRAALIKTGWGALVVTLGTVAGFLLDYFDIFEDGDMILGDHAKRLKEIKEQQEALSEAQKEGRESLQQQLDLLNAKSEEEKMHIQLGHEASTVETILIQKIVAKQQALVDEKQRLKDVKDETKALIRSKEEEKKIRDALVSSIRDANIEFAGVYLEGLKAEGKITDDNAKKLKIFLDFQKTLNKAFKDKIHIQGNLNDLSVDQVSIMETLNISLDSGNQLEHDLFNILLAIYNQRLKNVDLASEELSLREQIIGTLSEEQERAIEIQNIQSERANLILGQVNQTTSAITSMYQAQMNNEIDMLKKTASYRNADAERRKDMEDKIARKYAKKQKKIFMIDKAAQLASVYVNTSSAMMKAVAAFPLTLGEPWKSIIAVMGAVQAGAILATPAPQAFAKGGEFVTNKPEMIMVGEAGREHVKITPIDRPPERALSGGSTIIFNNPIMTEDFTRDQIIPAIEKATRLNLA